MATIVFHNTTTQPPPESHLMEPPPLPLTLRLELAPLPSTSQPFDQLPSQKIRSPELGFWSFSEAPQPSAKPSRISSSCQYSPSSSFSTCCFSSVVMSEKSLELCTENLGNETGCSEFTEADDDLFSPVPSPPATADRSENGNCLRRHVASKKLAGPRTFPPPLTTMRGSEPVHFRPHRGDGRLVIEAVRAHLAHSSVLQAERSHGRLRLGFLKEPASASDPEPLDCQEKAQQEEADHELCREEQEVEMEEQERDDIDDCSGGGVDATNEKFGVKIENVEMFARTLRRCTGGGEAEKKSRLFDWGPFLVATS